MKRYKDTEYFITKDGDVYRDGRKLKPHKTKKGYHEVKLYSNSKSKIYYSYIIFFVHTQF